MQAHLKYHFDSHLSWFQKQGNDGAGGGGEEETLEMQSHEVYGVAALHEISVDQTPQLAAPFFWYEVLMVCKDNVTQF